MYKQDASKITLQPQVPGLQSDERCTVEILAKPFLQGDGELVGHTYCNCFKSLKRYCAILRLVHKEITGLVVFNTFLQKRNKHIFYLVMKPMLQLSLVYFMAYTG